MNAKYIDIETDGNLKIIGDPTGSNVVKIMSVADRVVYNRLKPKLHSTDR